jgi:hypothetical protein
MFEHIHILTTKLWINFGSAQIGETSNTVRDFGHTKEDGIVGKEGTIGSYQCYAEWGHANGEIPCDGSVLPVHHYHGTSITPDQGSWLHHSDWLQDNQSYVDDDMVPGGTGMFGHFAIHMPNWHDTTSMDDLRGADITDHSVAGSIELIPGNTCPSHKTCTGHTVHTNSEYLNNDTDNNSYWGVNGHNGAGDLSGRHDAAYFSGGGGSALTPFETVTAVNLQG